MSGFGTWNTSDGRYRRPWPPIRVPRWLRHVLPVWLLLWLSSRFDFCWGRAGLWKFSRFASDADLAEWGCTPGVGDCRRADRYLCWCGKFGRIERPRRELPIAPADMPLELLLSDGDRLARGEQDAPWEWGTW